MWSCKSIRNALRKGITAGAFLLLVSGGWAQQLSTTFSHDYSQWKYDGNSFRTVFIESYDQWIYNGLQIRTVFNGDRNRWKIGDQVELRTVFSGSFDQWEITGHGFTLRVQTTFHSDYSQWKVSGDTEGTIRTVFHNDFERWDIDVDLAGMKDDMEAAVLLVPILASLRAVSK